MWFYDFKEKLNKKIFENQFLIIIKINIIILKMRWKLIKNE